MGMSASQGRLLALSAQLSNGEFKAQQICNAKILLSTTGNTLTKEYNKQLDKKKLVIQNGFNAQGPTFTDLNARLLLSFDANSKQRLLKNNDGRVLVSEFMLQQYLIANGDLTAFLTAMGNAPSSPTYDSAKGAYYTNIFNQIQRDGAFAVPSDQMNDGAWLYTQLKEGKLSLFEFDSLTNNGLGDFKGISWQTGDPEIMEVKDDAELAMMKTKHEEQMADIQAKDKRYDLELKQIETEHQAIQVEYDSVKKIIDKNVENSFKAFG